MKNVKLYAFVLGAALAAVSCASMPKEVAGAGVSGADSVRTAVFWSPAYSGRYILNYVDGARPPVAQYNSFSTTTAGGFNARVLPGRHSFEISVMKAGKGVAIEFDLEAGQTYKLIVQGEQLSVVRTTSQGDFSVEAKVQVLPKYAEPAESAPHAVIVGDAQTHKEGKFTIHRIDGLTGSVGSPSIGWNYFIASGAYGNYAVRVSPGKHVLEYTYAYGNYFTPKSHTKEFDFASGKRYKFRIKNVDKLKSGLALAETEIAEY